MNAYDLDNTIYDGESGWDFYWFAIKEYPFIIRYMGIVLKTLAQYKRGKLSKETLIATVETYGAEVLRNIPDLDELVKRFWDTHIHKIKPFYYQLAKPDDILITASFSFFIEELLRRLKIQHCICSELDIETGRIYRLCYHANKAKLFEELYPDVVLDRYFGDSSMDIPMLQYAKTGYVVKKNKIVKIIS